MLNWWEKNFASCQLGDERLNKRAYFIGRTLTQGFGKALSEILKGANASELSVWVFANTKAEFGKIIEPHIQNNRYIENHPETGHPLRDRQIPHWQTILEMATKLGDKTEFGYLGVDIVLDQEKGPLLLEINARPGISIQIANQAGLLPRLDAIDSTSPKLSGVQEKIAFLQETFAVRTPLLAK